MQNSWNSVVCSLVQTLHLAEFLGVMTEEARPLCWTLRAMNSSVLARVVAATASPSVVTRQPRLPTCILIDMCSVCGEDTYVVEASCLPYVPYAMVRENDQLCEECAMEFFY